MWIGDRLLGEGSGHSKKAAEQQAAYHALTQMSRTDSQSE
ncbi:MAG: putative dsRNA-binding protein [Eubacterium sp.]|nr:putative dsRNA-binding protein [Eubacterium sp.]